MARDLIGHATQHPAFEAGVAVAAHHNHAGMECLRRRDDSRSDRAGQGFDFDIDASQFLHPGSLFQGGRRLGKICIDGFFRVAGRGSQGLLGVGFLSTAPKASFNW